VSAPNWEAWQFLLGEWVGEGTGEPGQGAGRFTFALDLQQTILVRRNHTDFPATTGPQPSAHDDLMVVYQQAGGPTRAIYFDNEGHVINYSVELSRGAGAVIFLSDPVPSAPRFRLSYAQEQGQALRITFEIAPPDRPQQFFAYLDGRAHRT
jgi:hypothetical protein